MSTVCAREKTAKHAVVKIRQSPWCVHCLGSDCAGFHGVMCAGPPRSRQPGFSRTGSSPRDQGISHLQIIKGERDNARYEETYQARIQETESRNTIESGEFTFHQIIKVVWVHRLCLCHNHSGYVFPSVDPRNNQHVLEPLLLHG